MKHIIVHTLSYYYKDHVSCVLATFNQLHSHKYTHNTVYGVPPSFTLDGQPPEAVVVDLQADSNNLVLPCGVTGMPTPSVSLVQGR